MEIAKEHTFWDFFKGGVSDAEFFFSIFLVFFGILIYTIIRIIKRRNQDIPINMGVWWHHKSNKWEMILSLLLIWPQVLFYPVYEDWVMSLLPETFKAVPHFIILTSGYFQHYGIVKLIKSQKK